MTDATHDTMTPQRRIPPPASCASAGALSALGRRRRAAGAEPGGRSAAAAAQTAGDYKALVCLFLFGGNDASTWCCRPTRASLGTPTPPPATRRPTRSRCWRRARRRRRRRAGSPARLGGVLPIAPRNAAGPQLCAAPADGRAADDVRHRQAPGHRAQRRPAGRSRPPRRSTPRPAHRKPPQPVLAQRPAEHLAGLAPEGATLGWGGRMGDLLAVDEQRAGVHLISAAGNAVWLSGRDGAAVPGVAAAAPSAWARNQQPVFGSADVAAALQRITAQRARRHVLRGRPGRGRRSARSTPRHRCARRCSRPATRLRHRPATAPTTPATTRSCSTSTR